MKGAVEPRLSRGLRDLLSEPMLARQRMIETIRRVYELYGFVPLGTPAVEYLDVLTGTAGQETQQSIFTVQSPEREALGLRFDLTVPLARVVAQYHDLPRPYRRYQVSPVWAADKPNPGRYREFIQFDLDSVGVESEIADTEIIAGMCDTLAALEVGPFRVRFSSRGLLNLMLAAAAVPEGGAAEVLRVLGKVEKVGLAQVEPGAAAEIDLVERISSQLAALGYGDDQVTLDLSIARGLAYYTGPVFEAVLLDAPQYGSVFGGGRYDNLVTRFLGERVPATGASLGVDRLLGALMHLGRAGGKKATAQVLVARIDRALEEECLAMTWELRRAGIPAELYLGMEKGVGKQIKYADLTGIPIVLLYGSTEKERGIVTLKDMEVGRELAKKVDARREWLAQRPGQRAVPRAELVATVREMLGAAASPPPPPPAEL